jgi:hypothetical protein
LNSLPQPWRTRTSIVGKKFSYIHLDVIHSLIYAWKCVFFVQRLYGKWCKLFTKCVTFPLILNILCLQIVKKPWRSFIKPYISYVFTDIWFKNRSILVRIIVYRLWWLLKTDSFIIKDVYDAIKSKTWVRNNQFIKNLIRSKINCICNSNFPNQEKK